jgi:hypothetical protein
LATFDFNNRIVIDGKTIKARAQPIKTGTL